jgi:hypothetical protein
VPPDAGTSREAGVDCGASGLVTLAHDQVLPSSITVDDKRVYWTTQAAETVMSCDVCGCGENPTTLAAAQTGPDFVSVSATLADWIDDTGTLMACALDGCAGSPTPIGAGFIALAAGATAIFGATADAAVVSCPASGCATPTTLASGQGYPYRVFVDSTNVYWIDGQNHRIMKCAIGGCGGDPTTLASGQQAVALAVGGSHVYWINTDNAVGTGAIVRCGVEGCNGQPTLVASGQAAPDGIAADDAAVYWTNSSDGTVMKCSASGCGGAPTTLASGQDLPSAITVDATSVYWANAGGDTIMKLTPK